MEPVNLVKMVGAAALLVGTFLRVGYQEAVAMKDEKPVILGNAQEIKDFQFIADEFKEEGVMTSWKRFLWTSLIIEGCLLVLTLAHFAYGNWFVGIQLGFLCLLSIIFFGYKPWLVRNRRSVSFVTYIVRIKKDPKALCLWLSFKGLE